MNISQKHFSQIQDQTPVLTNHKQPPANVPIVMKLTSASVKETFDKSNLDNIQEVIHKEVMKAQLEEEADASKKQWDALSGLMNELIAISCDTENPERWTRSKLVEARIRKLGVLSTLASPAVV